MADVRTTVTRQPIKTPPAPTAVRIYAVDGSHEFDVPLIDAKEAVALGGYSYQPSSGSGASPPQSASQAESVDLQAMTKADLQSHAETLGIHVTASMTKAEMIEAIQSGGK